VVCRSGDFSDRVVKIIRQIKIVRSRLVFGPPKHGKTRGSPASRQHRLRDPRTLSSSPPLVVTLPWQHPDGELVTARLLLWTREAAALNRHYFNHFLWKPALRHFYASVLLDGGESIKALSEYLGHADPGFTLRTSTHLMPSSSERTRWAVDSVFRPSEVPEVVPQRNDTGRSDVVVEGELEGVWAKP
jgi:integrase